MTTPTTHNNSSENQEDSIDIIALLQSIWIGKKLILKTVLVFMILGLFIAVFSQNKYTASTTIVPQSSSEKSGGSLGGLAALAGINLGGVGQQSSISPQLYPQILTNISFQKELLENTPSSTKKWKEGLLINDDGSTDKIEIRLRGDNPENWLLIKKNWKIISNTNNIKIDIKGIDAIPNFSFKSKNLKNKS